MPRNGHVEGLCEIFCRCQGRVSAPALHVPRWDARAPRRRGLLARINRPQLIGLRLALCWQAHHPSSLEPRFESGSCGYGRTSQYKYLHPKEVLVGSGVLNRSIPQVSPSSVSSLASFRSQLVNISSAAEPFFSRRESRLQWSPESSLPLSAAWRRLPCPLHKLRGA